MTFSRYGIYFLPDGALARAGAAWLGWDVRRAEPVEHPEFDGLDLPALTARPRKYGFHATVKAPFALAPGKSAAELQAALCTVCAARAPVDLPSLALSRLGPFFALTAPAERAALQAMAADIVRELDGFRAPLDAETLARRRKSGLSPRQDALLLEWGYPSVMEAYEFHLTLSGPVQDPDKVAPLLSTHWDTVPGAPVRINGLSLVGEAADGFFQEIAFCPFGG